MSNILDMTFCVHCVTLENIQVLYYITCRTYNGWTMSVASSYFSFATRLKYYWHWLCRYLQAWNYEACTVWGILLNVHLSFKNFLCLGHNAAKSLESQSIYHEKVFIWNKDDVEPVKSLWGVCQNTMTENINIAQGLLSVLTHL